MKSFRLLLLIMAMLLTIPLHADESGPIAPARTTAQDWLAIIDAGHYPQSWQAAAPLFRNAVSQQVWEDKLAGVRGELGEVVTRKFCTATVTQSLPNVPKGDYVVIKYDTHFENHQQVVETITTKRSNNGHWEVAGYFIRKWSVDSPSEGPCQ